MFRFLTSFRDDQRGTIAIIVAIMFVVLTGFAALAVDGGYLYWTRTHLQAMADSAALAGTQVIPSNSAPGDVPPNVEKCEIGIV